MYFFNEISKRSIQKIKFANIEFKGASLEEVLTECFKGQPIEYNVVGKTVVVNAKDLVESKVKVAIQQNLAEITGKVLDEAGVPLVGASVKLKGTASGTSTDVNGNFKLIIPNSEGTLIISYVGFADAEVNVSANTAANITLKRQLSQTEEIVVIGYGSLKRKNISGAVSTVKGADLDASVASNFSQTLQGKASGVQVIQATGQPGANVNIQIRSNPSNANGGVLYVIDGVPVNDAASPPGTPGINLGGTDQSPLNFINPNDIESIDF